VSRLASRRTRGLGRVFAVPLLLAAATLAGLVMGLAGGGMNDVLSWLLLAVPIGVLAFVWLRRA
jgi:hypothetical protein